MDISLDQMIHSFSESYRSLTHRLPSLILLKPPSLPRSPNQSLNMGDARDAASAAIDDLLPLHPLQRLQSPSPSISAFVHLVGLASFTVSFRWLLTNPNPANDAYGWHFQYLTIIGLLLSTITFLA